LLQVATDLVYQTFDQYKRDKYHVDWQWQKNQAVKLKIPPPPTLPRLFAEYCGAVLAILYDSSLDDDHPVITESMARYG